MSVDRPDRWRGRGLSATAISTFIVLAPIVGATGTMWLLAGFVSGLEVVWRVALLLGAASVAALVAERAARRLLPLAALLRLTMVFPDQAPSRLSVARQAGHPRALMERLNSGELDEATAARDILGLVGALTAHDRKTRGHSERVRAYTDLLAEELGLSEHERDNSVGRRYCTMSASCALTPRS